MPQRWLQVKGDPSIRQFLFAQQRQTSRFDERIDQLHAIVEALLTERGAFHVKIHYSSGQLTSWFHDDPFHYKVMVADEVLAPGFIDSLPRLSYEGRQPPIPCRRIRDVLTEFKRLRLSDEQIYLRGASIHRINGMINMTFSCDGSHYIDCEEFFARLEVFGKDTAA